MAFIQENIINIHIGLKHEYKLIHVSDVHAITYNEEDSNEEIERAKTLEQGWIKGRFDFANSVHEYYDESHTIPSKECLINIINYINQEKPIAAVFTGDIIDYYSKSNYDMLLEQFGNLNYPFVYACGNHESPASQYEDITFNQDGFVVLEFNDFKIVTLDDSTRTVSKKTLDSLKKELRSKKPIIVAMHVPIVTSYNCQELNHHASYFVIDEDNTDEITKEFINILVNNETIKAILCGHVHRKEESYFAPNKKQYSASSGLIGLINKIIVD